MTMAVPRASGTIVEDIEIVRAAATAIGTK